MEKAIAYNLSDNFIEKLTDFLCANLLGHNDFSRLACVFGGRRPALFLRRNLSQKIKKSLVPPQIFSIDDFVDYIISKQRPLLGLDGLDCSFLIYSLARKHIPYLFKKNTSFGEFLPWAKEIVAFIEQLDLEDIDNKSLTQIEKSAAIGYEIPANINELLKQIVTLRKAYHKELNKNDYYSRGMRYRLAANIVGSIDFGEFDKIIFCNFFYLQTSERKIIKIFLENKKGICIFQGSQKDWSVLEKNSKELGCIIEPPPETAQKADISLYQGFDLHSQVCLVKEILKAKVKNKSNTLIVLPRPEMLIPLLTQISSELSEFNVSMGYPLKRSALYVLFYLLLSAQKSKKNARYYAKDYLEVLSHPLIKNLKLKGSGAITRVMVHKIEDLLKGQEESSIGGSLFFTLADIEKEEKVYLRTVGALGDLNIKISTDKCRDILKQLHTLLFRQWEDLRNFTAFCDKLNSLLKVLTEKSRLEKFPLNFKAIEKLYEIKERLGNSLFSKEEFSQAEIWDIFKQSLESELISFVGSPLRGTQILGFFETRSLNFDNLIIVNVNESILPKLSLSEPLIPQEVMLSLGLNRLEKEEEIQRYQFMRLIKGAKKAHLIYEENQEKEKSRFIEDLLWQEQCRANKLKATFIPKASFSIAIKPYRSGIDKNQALVSFLKKQIYSATRINTYLICPLRFYYRYVLGLAESEDLLGDPDASHIGIFIHQLLQDTFWQWKGKKPLINKEFKNYFLKVMREKFDKEISQRMKSDSLLLEKIIENRLLKFLDLEKERDIVKIICLEEKGQGIIRLANKAIQFQYAVDRIDEQGDKSIVIIDYKTGGADLGPKKLSSLKAMEMNRQSIRDTIKSFQLPLYYYFMAEDFVGCRINAEFYSLRTLERKKFISQADYPKRQEIMDICLRALECLFFELFNCDIPFLPDRDKRRCRHCPFWGLCR